MVLEEDMVNIDHGRPQRIKSTPLKHCLPYAYIHHSPECSRRYCLRPNVWAMLMWVSACSPGVNGNSSRLWQSHYNYSKDCLFKQSSSNPALLGTDRNNGWLRKLRDSYIMCVARKLRAFCVVTGNCDKCIFSLFSGGGGGVGRERGGEGRERILVRDSEYLVYFIVT